MKRFWVVFGMLAGMLPLISALVDASGLVVYFLVARFVLGV